MPNITIDLTPILQAAISICAALITAYLIPLIQERAGQERTWRLCQAATIAVQAAEQMCAGSNQEKLNYALEYLQERGFTLSPDALRAAVESAVYDMKRAAEPAKSLDAA